MSALHQHWTKHLSEAGSVITYMGDRQESRRLRASQLRREAAKLDEEYAREERDILKQVSGHWEPDEIAQAQTDAQQYATVRDRHDAQRRALYDR